ncbi:hypothetical protein DM01DRAFT_1338209 [Hesseltinella vesiculosa]|uniref:Uncharacterized protein n=1 Tax=Hesseltinella vesiculosa TaxID=101127 RepID=A0A1X2GB22_9FUNG|nr:hypothetical protein DM01DRAFT_1338209 [Hesseltinella vesiculosa]
MASSSKLTCCLVFLIQVTQLLAEADLSLSDDDMGDYLAAILDGPATSRAIDRHSHSQHLDALQSAFLGADDSLPLDEHSHQLIQQLQAETDLDAEYEDFQKGQAQRLEDRINALDKKSFPVRPSTDAQPSQRGPRGRVPEPLAMKDVHDEMDDWCCICNDDAALECLGCDGDKFCHRCFYETHQSETADFGFDRHQRKAYTPAALHQ